MNIQSLWQFAKDFDDDRKRLLEDVDPFPEIVERIMDELTITHFGVCRGKEGYLKNCFRPQFTLEVKTETFDLFFNSPLGYRAQYLLDPDEGQKQNAKLIDKLSEKLLGFAKDTETKYPMNADQIITALRCCSAKVWISEEDFNFDHELIEDILVPEWHEHARAAVAAYANNQYPSPPEQEKAIWGIRAPIGSVLDIKGAFLDGDRNEVVPRSKVLRRFEIQRYGFA